MHERVDSLFTHCRELLTLGDGPATGLRKRAQMQSVGCVEDGAIAVAGGRIVAVGTTAEVAERYFADCETDLSGFVVTPGFVDAHTRPVFPGGVMVDGAGVEAVVRAVRASSLAQLQNAVAHHLDAFLAHGTTAIAAKTGFGLSVDAEMRSLQALAAASAGHALTVERTFFGAAEIPVEFFGAQEAYVREIIELMLPQVVALADSCEVHAEPHVFERRHVVQILEAARAAGLSLRVYTDVSSIGGAELAADLGVVSAAHLGRTSLGGQLRLADSSIAAVLLPTATLASKRGGHASARAMVDRGCGVVLASDFSPRCGRSMPMVIGLGVTLLGMTVEECINAVTINPAVSIGRDGEMGSLHAGKRANFVALDVPSYTALGQLRGGNPVGLTVVDGEPVVANLTEWEPATW